MMLSWFRMGYNVQFEKYFHGIYSAALDTNLGVN